MTMRFPAAQGHGTHPLLLTGEVVWPPGSGPLVTAPSPPVPWGQDPLAEYNPLSPTCTNTGAGTTYLVLMIQLETFALHPQEEGALFQHSEYWRRRCGRDRPNMFLNCKGAQSLYLISKELC